MTIPNRLTDPAYEDQRQDDLERQDDERREKIRRQSEAPEWAQTESNNKANDLANWLYENGDYWNELDSEVENE